MTYYSFFCTSCSQMIFSTSRKGTCQFCLNSFQISKKSDFEEFINQRALNEKFEGFSSMSDYKILKILIPICGANKSQIADELEKLSFNPLQKYRIIIKLRQMGLLIGIFHKK